MMKRASGLTMIELMVVIAVIAILITLVLSAVQAIRESTRKVTCQNNLRQTVLALLESTQKRGTIPGEAAIELQSTRRGQRSVIGNFYVVLAQELSFPCTAVNGMIRWDGLEHGPSPSPSFFSCPSGTRGIAFRINIGVEPTIRMGKLVQQSLYGSFPKHEVGLASVTDGLSYTTILAERNPVTVSPSISSSIAYDIWATSFDEMRSYCDASYRASTLFVSSGQWWSAGSIEECYDHSRTPNVLEVDCASTQGNYIAQFTHRVMIAARSYHSGGVNTARLDGSVRFVNDSVDLIAWRATGTHNQHDVVGEE